MSGPFIPHPLPITNFNWERLLKVTSEASAELARYDGLLQSMLNPQVLMSPLTLSEAVLSSKIEGTNATNSEVLEYEAGTEFDSIKTADIQEVKNYREALLASEYAFNNGRPLSLNLVKGLHEILMNGVRGHEKKPGQFRSNQNWIGPQDRPMTDAIFIPPSPMVLKDHLENWIKYANRSDQEPLLQTAVVHAQFEIIHPFMDGNGRIGRILIPILLHQKKVLHSPMFYLSEYLEEYRDVYCEALGRISKCGDWQGWVEFFLTAVKVQAMRNIQKVKSIMVLYDELKNLFCKVTKSQFALLALDAFFRSPIISSTQFMKWTGIKNRATLGKILRQLTSTGHIVLLRAGAGRYPSLYALPKLLNIAEGKPIFKPDR